MSEDVTAGDVTTADNADDSNFDSFFESKGEVEKPLKEKESVAPEAEEKAQTEEKETEEGDKHSNNYKAAMHEEREKRKILQREFEETKAKTQRMEERFNELMYRQQQAQQQEAIPNFETDPLGALEYRSRKLSDQVYYQQQLEQQRQQEAAKNQEMSNLRYICNEKITDFIKKTPDYIDAYKHVMKTQEEELEIAGYNKEQIHQLLGQYEVFIANKALLDERNPAEAIYEIAKKRGYAKNSTDSADKIENLKKGIATSKTLTGKGNSISGKKISLEDVVNMSDAEFAKFDWKNMRSL